MKECMEVIRQLPRPTVAQTERFARYVSRAHSWYKHLPIRPKVPFVFFLDPGAGMNRVHTRTGETALVEINDESTRFHYTWQKTQEYRQRFGYWNYHAAYGTSFMYAGEGGTISTAGAGLKILTQMGDWVSVPPELIEKGTAFVNAFVHPGPNFSIWANTPAQFGLSMSPDSSFDARLPATLRDELWTILQDNRRPWRESLNALPPQVMAAIQPNGRELRAILVLSMEQSWDWPTENWLKKILASGVKAALVPLVVKHVEVEMLRPLLVGIFGKAMHEAKVIEAIVEERGGQLAEMTDAMYRVVAAVYPP